MKRGIVAFFLACMSVVPLAAQTPETPAFPFPFPLDPPTEAQIDEAYDCVLDAAASDEAETACAAANNALALSGERARDSAPDADEVEAFVEAVRLNPALALRLDVIATYYSVVPLVEPPPFAAQPITELSLDYSFVGLGNSVHYQLTIRDGDSDPVVTGTARNNSSDDLTMTPQPVSERVDAAIVQAFGPALSDLVPTGTAFTTMPCWDYYPDWTVTLRFADDTEVTMATHESNVVGIGGPWQTEIDGQFYMQYSGAFAEAVLDLLEALDLPLGETAAMGCGGANEPLADAYPREDSAE